MTSLSVVISLSPAADELQRFAAGELQSYLERLFQVRAQTCVGSATGATHRFLLGLVSDAHIQKAAGSMPALSRQGHLVRRISPDTMVLAGGSSAAVAWAVYELVENYGVRYLLHGDVLPQRTGAFHLPAVDAVCEPSFEIRSWRQFNDLPTGPVMWSLAQQESFINQIFKLKFNSIYFCLWPQHPFVDYEVQGIRRKSATLLFGQKIPIDDDTIGREHLPDIPFLNNPELIGAETFSDMLAAGQRLVNGILDIAQNRGMHTAIAVQPLTFPVEFRPLLEKPTEELIQVGGLTCAERADLTNPNHMQLVQATLAAYLEHYGRVDEFILLLPEHPEADQNFARCWKKLDAKYKLEPEYCADDLLATARRNYLVPGGPKRAEREFKSAIVMIDFLHSLFSGSDLLQQAGAKEVRIGLSLGTGAGELLPFIDRLLWQGATISTCLDYTSSRAARRIQRIERLDTSKVPASLVLTFQDDNIGSLPQVATENIHILVQAIRRLGWRGYFIRSWPIGDLDPVVAYLARSSWGASVTPRRAYEDHFTHVYGEASTEALCQVMHILGDATVILDLDFLTLLFPVLGIMEGHLTSERPMAEGLFHVLAMYELAGAMLHRLVGLPGPASRQSNLSYWTGRLDFSIHALREIELLCEGGIQLAGAKAALEPADQQSACKKLARSRELYNRAIAEGEAALEALAANVRDDCDRASLAAYYHFLVREVKQKAGELLSGISEPEHSTN